MEFGMLNTEAFSEIFITSFYRKMVCKILKETHKYLISAYIYNALVI